MPYLSENVNSTTYFPLGIPYKIGLMKYFYKWKDLITVSGETRQDIESFQREEKNEGFIQLA